MLCLNRSPGSKLCANACLETFAGLNYKLALETDAHGHTAEHHEMELPM
jgi:hypothetical protein